MSLASTADHFLDHLSQLHEAKLRSLLKSLNGYTIKVGTTCSGIETGWLVVDRTLEVLNRRFSVEMSSRLEFAFEKDEGKRNAIRSTHAGKIQHLYADVVAFGSGKAYCFICEQEETIPRVDLLITGPACVSLSKQRGPSAKDFAGCYADGTGESGLTYVCGYKQAMGHTHAVASLYENVKDATHWIKDAAGVKQEPQVNVAARDMKALGHVFEYGVFNANNYLLQRRRLRTWGSSDLAGGPDEHDYQRLVRITMANFMSSLVFPLSSIMDSSVPKNPLSGARPKANLKSARQQARKRVPHLADDVYIDTSASEEWGPEWMAGALTCIRPSHGIYSLQYRRHVTPGEMLAAQGIFPDDFPHPAELRQLIATSPNLAHDLAGNAFATTLLQSKLLASLVHGHGWRVLARCHQETVQQPQQTETANAGGSNASDHLSRLQKNLKRLPQSSPLDQPQCEKTRASGSGSPSGSKVQKQRQKRIRPTEDPDSPAEAGAAKKQRGYNQKGDCISISKKLALIKTWMRYKADPEVKNPGKVMSDFKIPGYYAGCMSKSKWLGSMETYKWEVFEQQCPGLAAIVDEVPNFLRPYLDISTKKGREDVLPIELTDVMDSLCLSHCEAGVEMDATNVQNMLEMVIAAWNAEVEKYNGDVQKAADEMLARADQAQSAELGQMEKDCVSEGSRCKAVSCKMTAYSILALTRNFCKKYGYRPHFQDKPGKHLDREHPAMRAFMENIQQVLKKKTSTHASCVIGTKFGPCCTGLGKRFGRSRSQEKA